MSLERNLEALLRAAGARPRTDEARARFLAAATARRRPSASGLAAAVLLLGTLAAVFQSLQVPPPAQVSASPRPADPEWIAPWPLTPDPPLSLKLRLPSGRGRTLRLEGATDLPDHFVLFLAANAERESFDGLRLRPRTELGWGGFAQVTRGRFAVDIPWPDPAPLRLEVRLDGTFQRPDAREAMKGRHAAGTWILVASAWDGAFIDRVGPSLDELGALAAEFEALVLETRKASASEARWKAEGTAIAETARALLARIERSPVRKVLSAGGDVLFYAARHLAGDAAYFSWKRGAFDGPVSYHAGDGKLKTFRGDEWSFDALLRYANDARDLAARELALWLVKDVRRGGRPGEALLERVPAYAERLKSGTDLDAIEAELRR